MNALLLPFGLVATLLGSPLFAQTQCRDAPVVLRLTIEQRGTNDRHLGQERDTWGSVMFAQMRKRCKGCISQGDAYTYVNMRTDDQLVVSMIAPQDTSRRPVPVVPRTTATLTLTIIHTTYTDAIVQLSWEDQKDTLQAWARAREGRRHSALEGNEERVFGRVLDALRDQDDRIACLVSPSHVRRTASTVRFSLWSTELLTERDFAANEDLRMQQAAFGRSMDWEIHPLLDARLRGELGAGWLYFTDSGQLLERNGEWMAAPVLSASLGGAGVLYPAGRDGTLVPYLVAGGDVVTYIGHGYTVDRPTWRPEFSFPSQAGWAVTLGVGMAKPHRFEVLGRWTQPTVRFIGESRNHTVFDLSMAVGIPRVPKLLRSRD